MKKLTILFLLFSLNLTASELSLMTWNVFLLPKPIYFSKQQKRIPKIIEKIKESKIDFVVVNEAFLKKFKNIASKDLKDLYPFQHFLTDKNKVTDLFSSGVGILSKYPFKILEDHLYKKCAGFDCFAAKGFTLVELELNDNKKVQIASTHMNAEDTKKAIMSRAMQFSEIKFLLDLHAKDGVPQILIGDLNVDANSNPEELQNALDILEMETGPLFGNEIRSFGYKMSCYNKKTPESSQWLDHIFITQRGSHAEISSREVIPMQDRLKKKSDAMLCDLSDHHAFKANLSF